MFISVFYFLVLKVLVIVASVKQHYPIPFPVISLINTANNSPTVYIDRFISFVHGTTIKYFCFYTLTIISEIPGNVGRIWRTEYLIPFTPSKLQVSTYTSAAVTVVYNSSFMLLWGAGRARFSSVRRSPLPVAWLPSQTAIGLSDLLAGHHVVAVEIRPEKETIGLNEGVFFRFRKINIPKPFLDTHRYLKGEIDVVLYFENRNFQHLIKFY